MTRVRIMSASIWVMRVGSRRLGNIAQAVPDAAAPFSHGEQYDAAVGREAAAIEIGRDLLARDGRKREWRNRNVVHRGRGSRTTRAGLAWTPETYAASGFCVMPANPKIIRRE